MWQVGLVGKPNAGKSTFFSAATLIDVKIAPYPFTTVDANKGVGYVRIECVCRDFNVKDDPVNSRCIKGFRFIPIELIDVAGLVPDAWKGRGLGNRFLDELRRADVLIHVVDASGGTDIEGRPITPGGHDPLEDVKFLEHEINMWVFQILKKDWDRLAKRAQMLGSEIDKLIAERLSGLGVSLENVQRALQECGLFTKKVSMWDDDVIFSFVKVLRELSKPMVIAANKADIPQAEENIKRLREAYRDRYVIVPTCAEAELALRKAAKAGLIEYLPGDHDFKVVQPEKLTPAQVKALDYIRENVFKRWGSTGVQEALNKAIFDVLGAVAVFPVENEYRLTDHHGRVLPDAFLVRSGTTVRDFAGLIHSELKENFMHAIDVRTKKKLPGSYVIRHRDVIKIVTRK